MTDHPLTDEICKDLSSCITTLTAPGEVDPYVCPQYIADDMRSAADWELERVIEFIIKEDMVYYDDPVLLADYIKKAMRPTTTQEES